jgi:hypothetical protein
MRVRALQILAFVIAFGAIAVLIFYQAPTDEAPTFEEVAELTDPYLGLPPSDARMIVVSHMNYQIAYQGTIHEVLLDLLPEFDNHASFVFKHAPIAFPWGSGTAYNENEVEDGNFMASEAVLCANEQGYFKLYHEKLVDRPSWMAIYPFDLERIAEAVTRTVYEKPFDTALFDECLHSRRYKQAIIDQNTKLVLENNRNVDRYVDIYFDGTLVKTLSADLYGYRTDEERTNAVRKILKEVLNPPPELSKEEQEAEHQEALLNQTCPEDPKELRGVPEGAGESDTYEVLQGCLYYRGERVFLKNLYSLALAGAFGEPYKEGLGTDPETGAKPLGELLDEWFRFSHNGDLYIFLKGGAGCECWFDGPYLVIDELTSRIEFKSADIPDEQNIIRSPNNKRAIEFEFFWSDGYPDSNEQVFYLYDFTALKRVRELYRVPAGATMVICELGCSPMLEAVHWVDDTHIEIHPVKRAEDGMPVFLEGTEGGKRVPEFVGEPITIYVP